MTRIIPIIPIVLILVGVVRAQQVELKIESRTLQEGETVEMTLTCTNTGDPETPQMQAPAGLEIRLINASPHRSSMVSIVNGRRSETTTHTFSLRLTALKAGRYFIPPIAVPAAGTTYVTDAIPITVTKPSDDAGKDGDNFIFARINAQPRSLYVTQSIEATLTVGIRKFERDGQAVDLGNLLQYVDAGGSDLSVFGTRFNSSEVTLADSAGKSHEFILYRQTREVPADQVGTMKIGPVFFKMNYPVSLRRSLFGGYDVAQHRRETARAAAIEIEVKGPPGENRPPDFTGAIGQFEFSASAKPTRVEQGQPVTLTLSIKGNPIDAVVGPDLKLFPELAARFDFSTEESPGEKEGGGKVFRRAIFPKRPGEQVIPPISWSYFDPATEQYVTRSSPAISIVVDPPSSPPESIDFSTAQPDSVTKLTRTSGGISPNVVDARRALTSHGWAESPALLGAAVGLPPAIWFAAMVAAGHASRIRTDPAYKRRRSAMRTARMRITRAQTMPRPSERCDALASALGAFLSDRFGLPPGELTPSEAQRVVSQRTGSPELASQTFEFLMACDAGRYAGAQLGQADGVTARQAEQIIRRIEKAAT